MARPPTDTDPKAKPRYSLLTASGWGLTCAVWAGGVWLNVLLLMGAQIVPNAGLRERLPNAAIGIALTAAFGGLLGGLVIGLCYRTALPPRGLTSAAIATGFFGGLATIHTIILLRGWLNPFASSTLLWCSVGFLGGVGAHRLSHTMPTRPESEDENDRARALRAWIDRAILLLALIAFITFTACTISTTRY